MGTPDKGIQPVELDLRGAGFLVVVPEMPWSDRRAYDAGFDEAMAQIDAEVNEGGPPAPERTTEPPRRIVDPPDSEVTKPKKRKR